MTHSDPDHMTIATLNLDQTGAAISRDIFGQFAEMLGTGIYGGVWVGEDSDIPNVRGIRTDVVEALRALKVPNVRWPGGCYADKYHWREGIGPVGQRTARLNMWGRSLEPNTFGTHEFMDFVEQIGSEAYISVNVGSGTVQEAADWLEYMTTDQPTALGLERQANGREKPWMIKYLGLGNEPWGCGGSFSPQAYVELMKQFGTHVQSSHPDQVGTLLQRAPLAMKRVAAGYEYGKVDYTRYIMEAWAQRLPYFWNIEGLSLHHYTHIGATPFYDESIDFGEREYAHLLSKTLSMHDMIVEHSAIMDEYDPQKKVALVIDEWGAWLKPLPGANMMFLRQQNSLRDAILTAVNFNIFARHADRVRLTNIAQMINVIQAMILTEGPDIALTPTYYVYRMYVPFQDAAFIPLEFDAGKYRIEDVTLPRLDAIAGRAPDGAIWLALTNIDPSHDARFRLQGTGARRAIGETLTADAVNAINELGVAPNVAPVPFEVVSEGADLNFILPAKSVTVVRLEM